VEAGGFGGIPLIDFREILKNANELWATVYALPVKSPQYQAFYRRVGQAGK
jgi:hypothetical protein